jgi:hypothetical protein
MCLHIKARSGKKTAQNKLPVEKKKTPITSSPSNTHDHDPLQSIVLTAGLAPCGTTTLSELPTAGGTNSYHRRAVVPQEPRPEFLCVPPPWIAPARRCHGVPLRGRSWPLRASAGVPQALLPWNA